MTTATVEARPQQQYQIHPTGDFVLPRWRSPSRPDAPTRGPYITDFAHTHCRTLKGPLVGNPLDLRRWQQFAVDEILEEDPDTSLLRYRTGIIGVGRQNGKSTTSTPIALDHIIYGPPGSEAYAVAGDRQQARIIFEAAKRQVEGNQELSRICKLYRDAIEVTETGSIFRTLSSDAGLAQGLSPSLVLFDEVHVQKDDELWNAMSQATGARDEALVLGITTAGYDPDSLLGQLYTYGVKVATGEIIDPTFLILWWEPADDKAAISDPAAWMAANPSLYEGVMNIGDFESQARRTQPGPFRRYRLNQWGYHLGNGWMDMSAFDTQADPDYTIPDGAPIAVSFDGSVSNDATVLMAAATNTDTPTAVLVGAWEKPEHSDDEWQVPRDEVHAAVEDLFTRYEVVRFQADPAYWRSELEEWRTKYGEDRVWDWPVTNQRMGPAVAETYKRIKEQTLRWDGNPTFRRHVQNAVTKPVAGGYETLRKDKPKSARKIDAAVTLVILVDALQRIAHPAKPKRRPGRLRTY